MIIDGNYHFLDLKAHMNEFFDIFKEFYGEEHAERLEERLGKFDYVPYHTYEYIVDYNAKFLTAHRDEVIAEYCRLSGRKGLTPDVADMIWNKDGSWLLAVVTDGDNLDRNTFKGPEYKKQMHNMRNKLSRKLGLDYRNQLAELQREAKLLNKAIANMSQKWNCDVAVDVNHAIRNRETITQLFLTYVTQKHLNLTDKDNEIIGRPDFDKVDIENLDCKYFLFGETVEEPGLIDYFTTASQKRMRKSFEDCLEVLKGRCKHIALSLGIEHLKYIAEPELYDHPPKDLKGFKKRMLMEIAYQYEKHPELDIPFETADEIVKFRTTISQDMYAGCKFASRLIKDYGIEMLHKTDDELKYITRLDYIAGNGLKPRDVICFCEDDDISPLQKLNNFIHELNHVVGHGKARISRDKKRAYVNYGLGGGVSTVEEEVYLGRDVGSDFNGLTMLEENINERMAIEMCEMFLKKFENPFRDSDQECSYQADFSCIYKYWNFLTDRFYEKYKKALKDYRIDDESKLFFDFDTIPPLNIFDAIKGDLATKYYRFIDPKNFDSRGVLSFDKLKKLGDLIVMFCCDILDPYVVSNDMSFKEFNDPNSPKWANIPADALLGIGKLKLESDLILDQMDKDDELLAQSKESFADEKSIRGIVARTGNKVISAINRLTNKDHMQGPNDEDYFMN